MPYLASKSARVGDEVSSSVRSMYAGQLAKLRGPSMAAVVGSALAPSVGVTDAWPVGLGVLPPPQAARKAATPAIVEPWRNTRRGSGRADRRWSRTVMR